jgi:hypothetical protein
MSVPIDVSKYPQDEPDEFTTEEVVDFVIMVTGAKVQRTSIMVGFAS